MKISFSVPTLMFIKYYDLVVSSVLILANFSSNTVQLIINSYFSNTKEAKKMKREILKKMS